MKHYEKQKSEENDSQTEQYQNKFGQYKTDFKKSSCLNTSKLMKQNNAYNRKQN